MSDLLLRRDLLRRGMTEDAVRRAVRAREWLPLRRGAYLDRADPRWHDAAACHIALTDATYRQLAPGAVISHVSAAARHSLPVWGIPLETVHVTRNQESGGRGGPRMRLHAAGLPAEDVVVVSGLPTTSVARTVIDVARTAPFEAAVAVTDAALHSHLATEDGLAEMALTAVGMRGIGRARAVLAFADRRADGPGESRSRVRMDLLGVAPPVLQHRFVDHAGRTIGIVDFWWPEAGVIGEFDGLQKYGRSLRPGESPAEAVVREKRREDALRALPEVRAVVRWTWSDTDDFATVAARLPRSR